MYPAGGRVWRMGSSVLGRGRQMGIAKVMGLGEIARSGRQMEVAKVMGLGEIAGSGRRTEVTNMGLGKFARPSLMGALAPTRSLARASLPSTPTLLWRPGVPLLRPRWYSSESQRVWKECSETKAEKLSKIKIEIKDSLRRKLEQLKTTKTNIKLYLCQQLKASAVFVQQIAVKLLDIAKEIFQHVSQEVTLGYKAWISQSYFYCVVLGVVGTALWITQKLNLLENADTEGNESKLDNLAQHLEDLLKEFPYKVAIGVLYIEVFVKVLKEIAAARTQLTKEVNKKLEMMSVMIKEVQAENNAVKAELRESQKIQEELSSQIEELKKDVSKRNSQES